MPKPITLREGNVAVKIYRRTLRKAGKEYQLFGVADHSSGKRKLISFASEAEARDKARDIAAKLANQDDQVLRLSGSDRGNYLRALELLGPTGVELVTAAGQFADAHRQLGGRSLADAVSFFLKRNAGDLPQKTVLEVFDEMHAAKKADKVSEVYLKDLKFRAGGFAEAFNVQISSITPTDLNAYLRAMKCSPRSRNNHRGSIATLFSFAEAAGYLPKGHIDLDDIARAQEKHESIEIFSAKEIAALLRAAQMNQSELQAGYNLRYASAPDMLLFLLLGGFAGLRSAEIERQRWEDIHLDRGFIRVTGAKGNTQQKRLVPIAPNLAKWLAPLKQATGPVCHIARTPAALKRLAKRAGVTWKHNALRHSFISYRVAECADVARVSLEAGNSPKMIHRHYRELVTADEAKQWFAIEPAAPENLVSFSEAGAVALHPHGEPTPSRRDVSK